MYGSQEAGSYLNSCLENSSWENVRGKSYILDLASHLMLLSSVTLSVSTTLAPLQLLLQLPSSGCVCTKPICPWTWKDPSVNAIWNQFDLLVAEFEARDLYSCSISVCIRCEWGFCFSCRVFTESTAATGEIFRRWSRTISSSIFQQIFQWDHVYCLQSFWSRCQYFSRLKMVLFYLLSVAQLLKLQ